MFYHTVTTPSFSIRRLGRVLLSRILSPYAKRIFFLTSLYVQMRHQHINLIHQNTLRKLNETLKLARTEDALMLAAHAHRVVWNGDALIDIIEHHESVNVDAKCEAIIKLSPTWLRYGSEDAMKKDIGLLLQEIK